MKDIYRQLMWNEKITIYHRANTVDASGKEQTTWSMATYESSYWGHRFVWSTVDGAVVRMDAIVVRIPAGQKPTVGLGDIVVKGEVTDVINGSGSNIKNKYKDSCFEVVKVTDNTKLPNTAHWYLSDK